MLKTVRVWDLPTRLFHWVLVACVVGLVVTGNVGGGWMPWHMRLGYAVFTLLLFRLVWGILGGHWSRFSSFVPSPARVVGYLRGTSEKTPGHNPLGALSVLALLSVLAAQVVSGLLSDDEIAFTGPWVAFVSGEIVSLATWYHAEVGKLLLIGLVVLHLVAIAFYAVVKKQRLVKAMISGDSEVPATSTAPASQDDARSWLKGAVVLLLCAAAVAWAVTRTPAA